MKITKKKVFVAALAVCLVAILSFATLAWFTAEDDVTNKFNFATSGDTGATDFGIDVYEVDKDGNSLVGESIPFVKVAGHESEPILWEPGCTYEMTPVYVHNEGNLALKYKIDINGIDGDAKLLEAIEWSVKVNDTVTDLDGFEEVLNADAKSDNAIVLVGHMREEAGNEYQGLTADGISITVYATQATVEYDSFDNQYDANAEYPIVDADDLSGALADGKEIKLEADIVLSETIVVADDVKIDLNGYDLDASALDSAFTVATGTEATITIEGVDEEVKLGKNGLVDVAEGADAVIEINGGNFVSDDAASTLIKPNGDGDIKIVLNDVNYKSTATNGYALDCSYYDGNNLSLEINGGSFEATTGLLLPEGSSVKDATITANNTKNMQPAVYAMGDMTIENCIIKAEKSHAVAVAGGATLTVNNCEVYAGSDANALAFQVFSSGGTINVNNTTYTGKYGTTGKMNVGRVAIINIDGVEVYRKG